MKAQATLPWVVLILGLILFPGNAWTQGQDAQQIQRGQYLFSVAGGCACHTIPKKTPYVGGRKFPVPMGTAYSTNITQDRETGLGAWSDEEIYNAMVKGIRPDGQRVLPVMPYEAYSGMAEQDLRDLIAYLRTLKPVRREDPPAEFKVPFVRALAVPVWLQAFGRFSSPPPVAPQSGVERGKYLVEHVALCSDCHTPRNAIGVPNRSLYLAGNKSGPFDEQVPNITPDEKTGIGDWSRDEIADVLTSGRTPDQDEIQGLMAEVVFGTPLGYRNMTREDALAIADYLKSIPPIVNQIE